MAAKKNSKREAIPYQKIAKLVEEGWGAVDIAVKLDRITKGADPGHSIRAIISRMRTHGYKSAEGKVVKLKIARVGVVKKAKASKKVSPRKGQSKKASPQLDGKSAAAGEKQ